VVPGLDALCHRLQPEGLAHVDDGVADLEVVADDGGEVGRVGQERVDRGEWLSAALRGVRGLFVPGRFRAFGGGCTRCVAR
jgi:hypothetical protein